MTEGEKREPQYFKNFSKDHSRFKIVVVERDTRENNSPLGLLSKAEEYKRIIVGTGEYQIHSNDEFWIVVDVDRWPDLDRFIQIAESKGWKVAISNSCFEVWLYYHFFSELPNADLSIWDGEDWKQYVDNVVPGGFDSGKYWGRYQDAVRNAKEKFRELSGLPTPGNTSVFKIFEEFVEDYD